MITKIGHRGAMGYAPENTLASFKKALDLKIDAIELDVHVCKTGELVVIHDNKVNRTTNGTGYVADKTLAELKKLDAGHGEKIPTLKEALDLIDKKAKINIELKGSSTAKPVHELIKEYIVKKGWNNNHFIVSSFNHYELKKFKTLNPKIKIGAILAGLPINYAEFAEKVKADYANICIDFINREFVDDAHKRGIKIFTWVANELDDIKKMKTLKVDGIFSNYPDKL